MSELVVKIDRQVGLLNWNFGEINTELDGYLKKYENLLVREEDIKEAKAIKQELGRIKTQIEDRRKREKAEFCKPYDDFAAQVKEVTGKIDRVVGNITDQLNEYDAREKEEKRQIIKAYWEDICRTTPPIPFDKVFDKRMLNKTTTEKQWKEILDRKNQTIKNDLNAIAIMEPEKRNYLMAEYVQTMDMGIALNRWEQYQKTLQEAEEYRRRAVEKARPVVESMTAQNMPVERPETPVQAQNEQTPANTQTPAVDPYTGEIQAVIYHRALEVWGTREQIIALADFMNENGIKFRKVEI